MSAHDGSGAPSAWGRGYSPFTQQPSHTQQPGQQGQGQQQAAPAPTQSWRGAAASGNNQQQGAPQQPASRWPSKDAHGAPSSAGVPQQQQQQHPSGPDTDAETGGRSWFDGHHGNRRPSDAGPAPSGVPSSAAPSSHSHPSGAPAAAPLPLGSSASSSAWRSNRIEKIKSSSTASGDASNPSTPQLGAQAAPSGGAMRQPPAPQQQASEPAYQPSDFGNTSGDVRWYYLDPQRVTQGPFSASDMTAWYQNSYFDLQLPVQCLSEGADPRALHGRFIPLGVWFMHGNKAFLPALPDTRVVDKAQQQQHQQHQHQQQQQHSGINGDASDVDPSAASHPQSHSHPSSGSSAVMAGPGSMGTGDRHATVSPVDEASSYAASVHQLVADDDDAALSAHDINELERYNAAGGQGQQANAQGQQQGQHQPRGAQMQGNGPQATGLNPTAQPWNASRAQQAQGTSPNVGPAGAQPAWAAGHANARSSAPNPAAAPLTSSPPSQQQLAAQHHLAQQQQQHAAQLRQSHDLLLRLHQQYTSLAPLSIDQFCHGLRLTQDAMVSLSQHQLLELRQQWLALNQQRAMSQAQVRQQINACQMIIQQQQQAQQQAQGGQPQMQQHMQGGGNQGLTYQQQQQQYLLMQQQQQQQGQQPNLYQQAGQGHPSFGANGVDSFGRPLPNTFQNQPRGDAYNQQYVQQQQIQQQQQARAPYQQGQQQSYGLPAFPPAPQSKLPESQAQGDQSLRDQFGNMHLGAQQQQQQSYEQQQQAQPLQQQQSAYTQQAQPQATQSAELPQAVVYTPNQVQTASAPLEFQQPQQPQQPAPQSQSQPQPQPQQAQAQAQQPQQPQQASSPAFEAAPVPTPTYDEAPKQPEVADEPAPEPEEPAAEEPEEQQQQQQAAPEAEEEVPAEAAPVEEPQPPAPAAPSIAPWAGSAPKAKSLLEIQQEEERAQQAKLQKERQGTASRRALPFSTSWGGQAQGLSLPVDDSSSGSALLPTPPSTTPSIKLLTPILSTSAVAANKQARVGGERSQQGQSGAAAKAGKTTRRADGSPAQAEQGTDSTPPQSAVSPAASPNAWGTKPAAPVAAKTDAAPAPIVNAWATKRPVAGAAAPVVAALSSPLSSSSPLLPSPSMGAAPAGLSAPILTIRPKSMQMMEGGASAAPATKPLNTVRILDTQVLDVAALQAQREQGRKRGERGMPTVGSSSASSRSTGSVRPKAASSSAAPSSSSGLSVPDSAAPESSSAFGGPSMSAELEAWCTSHLPELGGDPSLPQFLMTLQSDEEVREYIHQYLGTSDKIEEFADGFLQLKAFEGAPQVSSKDSKAGGEDEAARKDKRERGGRRKKN